MGQQFHWKGLQNSVQLFCFLRHSCQFLTNHDKIYDNLHAKQAEAQPWDKLCIDLSGKFIMIPNKAGRRYAMKGKKDKNVYLQAITLIDPATDLIEISSVPEVRSQSRPSC